MEFCNYLDISLYFHIPFCTRKCPYCHFYVTADTSAGKKSLIEALRREWEQVRHKIVGKNLVSIYFGGGTPALFGPDAIGEILSWLPPAREITLEANPAESSLLSSYTCCGVNRLSLGIQSLHDPTLKMLGRKHTAQEAMAAIRDFANISIDLMYEVPGQTLQSWLHTLDLLPSLPITHLSLYNLTIEPGTVFYQKRKELLLPPPEANLAMLEAAVSRLESIGLRRYEISAFARPGFESLHNTGYWTGRPFLGLGPSAFSFWEGRRFRNIADLKKYAEALACGLSPVDFEESLPYPASLHERLAVALRLLEGVDRREYPVDPALYQALEARGWLVLEGHRARLTPQGLLFYDSVAQEIVL